MDAIITMDTLTAFGLGFLLASALAAYNEYLYKKILVRSAEDKQNEKILGKWYMIRPVDVDKGDY